MLNVSQSCQTDLTGRSQTRHVGVSFEVVKCKKKKMLYFIAGNVHAAKEVGASKQSVEKVIFF